MGVLQYYVNFQSSLRSLIVICDSLIRGDQGPPNFCLHRVARMLRPALVVENGTRKLEYGLLFAFCSNMAVLSVCEIFSVKE